VSTGVGNGDTLGTANGWDLWDSWDLWVGLISPISHIGPIGSRSPSALDAATLIGRRALLAPRLTTDSLITDYFASTPKNALATHRLPYTARPSLLG
jgi:hypothetical protein